MKIFGRPFLPTSDHAGTEARLEDTAHWSHSDSLLSPENTQFLRESMSLQLTSCFIALDSAALLMLNEQQIYLTGQIQASQTGGLWYNDTSP